MGDTENNYDSLEQLIYDDNIRILAIDVQKDTDVMLIRLNTGSTLQETLSDYKTLSKATLEELNSYELIGKGTGIHWPSLDEDISLKSFLRNAIRSQVVPKTKVA